jgi:glycosyltransferase involved in cell wall biosynthesis
MIFAPTEKWEKMYIVHCGVDPELFKLVSHQGQGKRLLYLGRLAVVKGLPILLQSLVSLKEIYPDVCLTLIGDGSDRVELEKLTEKLDLKDNVKFLGYKSQAEVREQMQLTDIFVLPSFAEGVPVSLMEAMAAGVPVVATQIAGVSELVDNGVSGYIVPPGDPKSLAEKIEKLIFDPELRTQFGLAGRQKIETEFNINKEADWLCQIMTKSLTGDDQDLQLRPHLE